MPGFASVVNHDPSKLLGYANMDTLTGLSVILVRSPEVSLMPASSEYMRIIVDCDPVNHDEVYRIILKNPKSNTPNTHSNIHSNIYEFQPGKAMELRYHPIAHIHEVETNLTFLEKAAKYFGYARKQIVHDYQSWITVTPLDSNNDPKVNASRKAEFIFRPDSNRMSNKELKPIITFTSMISQITGFISALGYAIVTVFGMNPISPHGVLVQIPAMKEKAQQSLVSLIYKLMRNHYFKKDKKDEECPFLERDRDSSPEIVCVSPNDNTAGQSSATSSGAARLDAINIGKIVNLLVVRVEMLEMRVDTLRTWRKLLIGLIFDPEFSEFLRNCFGVVKRQLKYEHNTDLEAASD
ncbi:hypothetical protein BGW42_004109 [Actinomortierella wolfii]|nr:hypothetical protein BGW42_004109 [Actinomortierella wolfii]